MKMGIENFEIKYNTVVWDYVVECLRVKFGHR